MTDSHIFSGPSCGQLCAVTATTLASVLLLGWNGKRWRERSCCWPHTRHTKNPPSHFGLLFFSIITSHGKSRWVLCLERRFCWESVTWSSPKLPPSLTVGQVGQKRRASSRLPVRRAGQHRLRRHLPLPATKDNLQEERPLLSPCLNEVAFQIFQPTSSWLRRRI